MRDDPDLLHRLADEHRDLTVAVRGVRMLARDQRDAALRRTAARIVEHELVHRLLIHPLLRRENWGRRIFRDRREEQLLLADRLRRALGPSRSTETAERCERDDTASLDLQLAEHTDREEILEFPHLRHVSSEAELAHLSEVATPLRSALRAHLDADPSIIVDASWATARRRALLERLDLPEDVVVVLPDAPGEPEFGRPPGGSTHAGRTTGTLSS